MADQRRHVNQTQSQRKAGRRVLLDRNAWSYLADAGAGPDLLRATLRTRTEIVVAPTVVFETLAIKNEDIRKRHISLLTLPNWHRLMPEAYSECMELLAEIQRLRPEWLRPQPDIKSLKWLRHDWVRKKGGFWETARNNPAKLAASLGIREGRQSDNQNAARLEAKNRRDQFREGPTVENWRLSTITGTPRYEIPGWDGDPVHPWRIAGLTTMTMGLSIQNNPYREWLFPDVDYRHLDHRNPSWGKFWLHDIAPEAMPRFWLRWAFEWLQSFQRYTPGAPADASLATYLPECDLFVSADANFIRNVIACKFDAPCAMPGARKVPGGTEGIEAILKLISGDAEPELKMHNS